MRKEEAWANVAACYCVGNRGILLILEKPIQCGIYSRYHNHTAKMAVGSVGILYDLSDGEKDRLHGGG